ncbi:MAG: phosphate/phosphite/phosphonate ABC transporter substrate-binding protein [Nitrospiraceae bacterium]|nr:MAG: phosphate/phosphite/phosphonate ABC transporter substrate-binding protein [Nitrospiraceae bacterium]
MGAAIKVKILSFLICLLVLVSSGCVEKETPKKVSLTTKTNEKAELNEYAPQDALWFGFDLRIGPKEDVRIYLPLLQYLEKDTGRHFRIKFAEKYESTVEDLGKGVTHFAAVGTLSYLIGEARYGIRYLVSGVNKEGDTTYNSIIFTSPGSSIEGLKDLKGKCFAFGSRMSTQGHLIPRNMLEDEGIHLEDLVRYIYTGSHLETVKTVLNGECDAGGIQDTLAKTLASEGKIKILKISEPFPGSLIAYSSSVDSKTAEAVRAALLAFDPRGKHKTMLVDWDQTEMPLGFSKVDELELNKVKTLAKKYGVLTE